MLCWSPETISARSKPREKMLARQLARRAWYVSVHKPIWLARCHTNGSPLPDHCWRRRRCRPVDSNRYFDTDHPFSPKRAEVHTCLPTAFDWSVPNFGARYSHPGNDDDNTDGGSRRQSRLREAQTDFESALAEEQSNLNRQNNTATVDRNTSLRSIMTLPAYRQKPSEEEHVLGREGERDGIDVVVELPTAEDEEALREDEMDALYQIRLARRRQLAEREERRQARREARLRHDIVALQEIRDQTRVAAEGAVQEIEELRGEHERQKDKRHRAVSSVSYHDVGIARHDGSRIRANSTESERVGLLSDAASIALSARSPSSLGHRRDRSASSVLSITRTSPVRPRWARRGHGRTRGPPRPGSPRATPVPGRPRS